MAQRAIFAAQSGLADPDLDRGADGAQARTFAEMRWFFLAERIDRGGGKGRSSRHVPTPGRLKPAS